MRKLKEYIMKWFDGKKIKGIELSQYDIYSCIDVYNAIVRKENPEFINGKVKEVLDRCGIKTVTCGTGWKVL